MKSIGFSGPLKKIEKKLDIKREKEIQTIDGREAAVLWSRFVKGDAESLKDLILYNISDTINLKKIMDFCYIYKIKNEILPRFKNTTIQQHLFGPLKRKPLENYYPNQNIVSPEITINEKGTNIEIFCNNKIIAMIQRTKIKKIEIKIDSLLNKIHLGKEKPAFIGIDLTGSEKRASGICILKGKDAYLSLINFDEDIIKAVQSANPDIVSIDFLKPHWPML